MKRFTICIIFIGVLLLTGCNTLYTQPRMREATIVPNVLQPADSAIIAVEVRDDFNIVDSVVAVVAENDMLKLQLRDDGVPPDAVAGDGIWTMEVEVPFQAPPGEYTLILTGYDRKGNPIIIDTRDGPRPLSTLCRLVVDFPAEMYDTPLTPQTEDEDLLMENPDESF